MLFQSEGVAKRGYPKAVAVGARASHCGETVELGDDLPSQFSLHLDQGAHLGRMHLVEGEIDSGSTCPYECVEDAEEIGRELARVAKGCKIVADGTGVFIGEGDCRKWVENLYIQGHICPRVSECGDEIGIG